MPALSRILLAALVLLTASMMFARAQEAQSECTKRIAAIQTQKNTIDTARKILSDEEADCAFNDFIWPASGHCAKLKADADAAKRKAWGDAVIAWSALERLRLSLREYEDRSGSICSAD